MTLSRKLRLTCLLCLLVCTVGCDQASKHIARTALSYENSVSLSGGIIELRLTENPGSFLSLGDRLPDRVRFVFFTLGIGIGMAVLGGYLTSRALIDTSRF